MTDKAPEDYPVERLHMIKHEHEDWVRVSLLGVPSWNSLAHEEKYLLEDNATHILNFVSEWLTFLDFFELFYLKTEAFLERPRGQREDLHDTDFLQWHKYRGVLRELLFLAGEKHLIVQRIRSWDKLKAENDYISEWNYDTPFSFILDFVNPTAMINHHGSSIWHSCDISREFIEGLSWKYPSIKALLEKA
jgi:hypothetical protein